MNKHFDELREIITPTVNELNALMHPLGEANIEPTDDIMQQIISFRLTLKGAEMFVMLNEDDQNMCNTIKQNILESASQLRFSLEVQHALHLNKN